MRLATVYAPDRSTTSLHLDLEDGLMPVDAVDDPLLQDLVDVAALYRRPGALRALRRAETSGLPRRRRDELQLAPPVVAPSKIICIGLNYPAHIEGSRLSPPDHVVLFSKFPSCLVADGEPVVRPSISSQLDYEGELAVIIGRRAHQVTASTALDYVGGYTIMNDVSARDLQKAEPQWIRGKALDTFAPLGPVVLDAASVTSTDDFRIRTFVNGEPRQDGTAALMITKLPQLIENISQAITLEPGDVIATGTPSGVGMESDPPRFLAPGDLVEVSIDGIGTLRNPVLAAS